MYINNLGYYNNNVADSLNNLALVYQNHGKYDEAERLFIQSFLEIKKIDLRYKSFFSSLLIF